jgi:2-hydroxychromene-2-carboxylate isomerase
MTAQSVDYYCDPGCPWTWMTSRWLTEVATERGLEIRWHAFSLTLLNTDTPIAPEHDTAENRANLEIADRAVRVLAVLSHAGEHDRAGRFYAEFGRRFHDGADADDAALFAAAASAAGVNDALESSADASVDDLLAASLEQALALAGPDVGSPVLRIGVTPRGFQGPIQSPPLTGAAALRLFDAIETLQAENAFFELKRGRSAGPALGRDVHH